MVSITAQILSAIYLATGICLARHDLLTAALDERPGIARLLYITLVGPAVLLWAIVDSIPDFGKDAPGDCGDDDEF